MNRVELINKIKEITEGKSKEDLVKVINHLALQVKKGNRQKFLEILDNPNDYLSYDPEFPKMIKEMDYYLNEFNKIQIRDYFLYQTYDYQLSTT